MTISELFVGLLSAFLGSLGFALIFRLRPRYLFPACIGGLLAYAVYLLGIELDWHIFATNFIAACIAALYSELFARKMKAPTLLFSIPCIIPLVPGSLLYYSMSSLLKGNYAAALSYFTDTVLTSIGIAGGMIAVSIVVTLYLHVRNTVHEKKNKT